MAAGASSAVEVDVLPTCTVIVLAAVVEAATNTMFPVEASVEFDHGSPGGVINTLSLVLTVLAVQAVVLAFPGFNIGGFTEHVPHWILLIGVPVFTCKCAISA